ncbi:MAG: sulfotransferase domain-containing protein [Chlorobiales bacterium]|nr:sulfotransferase domain-containing protein [Chlorobiales bacterium]
MKLKKKIKTEIVWPLQKVIFSTNYLLNNYKEIVWLIGDGRSGTTWLASLINYRKKYREMFEPFHPWLDERMGFFMPHLYMRENNENANLKMAAEEVFTGKYMYERVDAGNYSMLYNGLLVKDIFANLFSYWISTRYPEIKIILLIRNPFAVALSKCKKKNWLWLNDPMALLDQKDLYDDYLQPFEDVIRKTRCENDYLLCQILIWSIVNYVPLRQFDPGKVQVVFYEDVVTNPGHEVSKIFDFIRKGQYQRQVKLSDKVINKPSKYAGKESNIIKGTSPLTSWKQEMTPRQIERGMGILEKFGFDELYDDSSMPDRNVINSIQKS